MASESPTPQKVSLIAGKSGFIWLPGLYFGVSFDML